MTDIGSLSVDFRNFQTTASFEISFPDFANGYDECHIKIVMADTGQKRLHAHFEGVAALQFDDLRALWIKVESIKDHQWDELKYRVSELNDEHVFFYCRTFRHYISDAD